MGSALGRRENKGWAPAFVDEAWTPRCYSKAWVEVVCLEGGEEGYVLTLGRWYVLCDCLTIHDLEWHYFISSGCIDRKR